MRCQRRADGYDIHAFNHVAPWRCHQTAAEHQEHVGNLQQREKMESCAQEDFFSYLSMCNIIFLTAKELL